MICLKAGSSTEYTVETSGTLKNAVVFSNGDYQLVVKNGKGKKFTFADESGNKVGDEVTITKSSSSGYVAPVTDTWFTADDTLTATAETTALDSILETSSAASTEKAVGKVETAVDLTSITTNTNSTDVTGTTVAAAKKTTTK